MNLCNASALENAMLGLYRSIERLLPGLSKKIIQFIASREGEGASTIAGEFGRVVAGRLGRPALILDADGAAPKKWLQPGNITEHGWEEMLKIDALGELGRALCHVGGPALRAIPLSGPLTHEMANSPQMEKFLCGLKERFDFILVDSPAVAASPDGLAFCRNADGVVLVLEAESTRWPVAEYSKELIVKNGGRLLGSVFNKRRYHIPEFIYRRL